MGIIAGLAWLHRVEGLGSKLFKGGYTGVSMGGGGVL